MVRVVVLMVILLVLAVQAAPWLNWLTRDSNKHRLASSGRSGRDRFRSICRTINADNYAFPGTVALPIRAALPLLAPGGLRCWIHCHGDSAVTCRVAAEQRVQHTSSSIQKCFRVPQKL